MSESIILSDDELHQLTGRKKKSLQIRWLKDNKFHFHINLIGKPVILRSSLSFGIPHNTHDSQEPDFGALKNGKET